MAHEIDYVELNVDDLEAAKAFYARALGWTFKDYGPDYVGLLDATRPGHEFGGMRLLSMAARSDSGVLALIGTDDADAALASVVAAGGRIVVELQPYPGGRRFSFADPSGNVLGVYQPDE